MLHKPKQFTSHAHILSIYERHLRGLSNAHGVGHCILYTKNPSMRDTQQSDAKESNKTETITFKFEIEGTSAKGTIALSKFDDIIHQDAYEWAKKFKEASQICKWSAEAELNVFNLLVNSEMKEELGDRRTVETKTREMVRIQNPPHHLRRLLEDLRNVRQGKFTKIKEYHKAITETVKKISLCKSYSKTEFKNKFEETFMLGLEKHTAIKMEELGLNKATDVLKEITKYENIIIERTNTSASNHDTTLPKAAATKKYCTHHRSSDHNTADCFSLKPKTSESTKPTSNIKTVKGKPHVLKGRVNQREISVLLDTGAEENFVRDDFAKEGKITYLVNQANVKLANNKTLKITRETEIELELQEFAMTTTKITAKVLPGLKGEMILGKCWMETNNLVWDFSKDKISQKPIEKVKDIKLYSIIDTIKQNFEKSNPEMSGFKNIEHRINLTTDIPIASSEYVVPLKQRDDLRIHLNDLLGQGIIKLSKSAYSSPAFCKAKPNKDIRLLIDYSRLNSITVKEHFPFPEIYDTFLDLKGSTIFSQIDLKMGFYQIKINEADTTKTAFSILGQKYEFLRLPFGMKNAPFFFQMAMKTLLGHLPFVKIFIDDILIFSTTEEEHAKHLETVLETLKNNNVCVNFDKSTFGQEEVKFLGQVVNKYGIKPYLKPLDKLEKIKAPKTKRQLMKIIGIIQWFRPYVHNLSKRISPITEMLKKNNTVQWDANANVVLKSIIDDVKTQKILHFPDVNGNFTLETDASDIGIGSALTQDGKILGFYSRKFNDVEQRYSIVEKEFLAVLKSLDHFRKILLGCKTIVKTDNRNIINYKSAKNNRISRWAWKLLEYDIHFEHLKGVDNVIADSFSRNYKIETSETMIMPEKVNRLLEAIKTNPEENQITKLHEITGHPSFSKMKKFLKENGIKCTESLKGVKSCMTCHLIKHDHTRKNKTRGNLHSDQPNKDICSDICGPYKVENPSGVDTNYYIVTFICRFSRFTSVKIIKNIESKTIVKALEKIWITPYGAPKTILCDNGRQYTSKTFKKFCENNGIKVKYCTPNNARGNGVAERVNKTINEITRLTRYNSTLKEIKKMIELRVNLMHHTTTNCSPLKAFHNRNITIQEDILAHLTKNSQGERRPVDELAPVYKENEWVFIRAKTQLKQEMLYKGPFQITKVYDNYIVYKDKNKEKPSNIRNVRKWREGGKMSGT